jgi:hypothetical protein
VESCERAQAGIAEKEKEKEKEKENGMLDEIGRVLSLADAHEKMELVEDGIAEDEWQLESLSGVCTGSEVVGGRGMGA